MVQGSPEMSVMVRIEVLRHVGGSGLEFLGLRYSQDWGSEVPSGGQDWSSEGSGIVRIGVLRYLGGQDWSSEGSVMVRIGILRYLQGQDWSSEGSGMVRIGVLRYVGGGSGLEF